MNISIDKIENSEALIKIKLKEDDYQPAVAQKIKEFSKKANIKGFRPGKVPTGLIQKMYGTSFIVEVVNKIISDELNKVLREGEMQFLGEPLPADQQKPINWDTDKELEFVFNIGYAADFNLELDKKVKMDFHKIKIDKKVLDETIANLQKQFGEVSNPELIGAEDTLYGSLASTDGTINTEVSIDLTQVDKSIVKKLTGAKVEATVEIEPKKSFKDKDYFKKISRLTEDEIKKAKGKIIFTVKGINHTTPAEINQELFDKTFGKDVVKSEVEFNEKVKEIVSKNYEQETEYFFHHKVREKLLEKTKITLPNVFLKKWLLKTNDKMTESAIATEFELYATELKWSLIRNKISKNNNLKVEHTEVADEAKKMIIQQFGGPAVAAQFGEHLDKFADNYLKAENGDNYMKVFNQVQNQKVMKFITEAITTKDKEVSLDDFRKLE